MTITSRGGKIAPVAEDRNSRPQEKDHDRRRGGGTTGGEEKDHDRRRGGGTTGGDGAGMRDWKGRKNK